jgi:hypothetical protein
MKGCEGKYRWHAEELAEKIGCTKASVQSMRRKVLRLEYLGMEAFPGYELFALMLLVPEGYLQTHDLSEISAYARREHVKVMRFVRRSRVTGKPHLVGPYKRNIAVTAAEGTP